MKKSDNLSVIIKCPVCKKRIVYSKNNPFRPFCSDKCRLVDLSQWFEEDYRIESDEKAEEENNRLNDFKHQN